MALKAIDGFDHYNNQTDLLARSNSFLQWQNVTFGSFSTGRNGNALALSLGGNTPRQLTGVFAQRVASAGIGHAASIPSDNTYSMSFKDSVSGVTHITITLNSNNFSIQVNCGATQLYYSPNNVWGGNVWHYCEAWVVINSSTGSVLFKVDGETLVNLTAVNTQNGGNAQWDTYTWSGPGGPIDDFYYCDSTTDSGIYPNNAPIGDMRVFTQFATGNSAVQWTPLANTNWQEVSETAMDGDTSYNFSQTAGQEDLLTFSHPPATTNKILGVALTGAYRKDDATMRTIKQPIKSGVTKVYGATYSLPDNSYSYFTDMFILDPNTSANWALAAVNGITAGYNLVS